MNAIVRRDVSIVSAIPGTTRDIIEAALDLDGFPLTVSIPPGYARSRTLLKPRA